jgi:hypothetical protein
MFHIYSSKTTIYGSKAAIYGSKAAKQHYITTLYNSKTEYNSKTTP